MQSPVQFTSQGDRILKTQIEQLYNGTYRILGYYDPRNSTTEWCKDLVGESFTTEPTLIHWPRTPVHTDTSTDTY